MRPDNDAIKQVADKAIADIEHTLLFGNASTCTGVESPPLTVDALIKSVQKLKSLLPVVWYRFCEWLPDEIDGRPCNALGFKFGEDDVLFVHPDRFDQVKHVSGPCNWVEYPQERMEQQTRLDALRWLTNATRKDWVEKITKRVR